MCRAVVRRRLDARVTLNHLELPVKARLRDGL